MMKIIPIEEAVGKALSHELTGIIPGKGENITYPRGYVVKEEDLENLKNMGKYHVKVMEESQGLVHENDGALIIAKSLMGKGLRLSEPREGKVHGFAQEKGLLRVNGCTLKQVNLVDGIKVATRRRYSAVEEGEKVATVSITPLEIQEEVLDKALSYLEHPLVELLPFKKLKIGIITTGNEVFEGRIKDGFGPYIAEKLAPFGYPRPEQQIVPDHPEAIRNAIQDFLADNVDLVFLTGGLAVDADDYTMRAVREYPEMEIQAYGSPVLPGAMFLAAYYRDKVPFIGLPAGLLRGGPSVLDLVLPLLLAEVRITREYIASLGEGGLL